MTYKLTAVKTIDNDNSKLTHLAVIMDGNGRWAQSRNLPRALGHRSGAEALRRLLRLCPGQGIKYLTVFAFSTENWKRPAAEVQALMSLLAEFIDKELEELINEGVSIRVFGDMTRLSQVLQHKVEDAVTATKGLNRLVLSIMLNYSGRQELLRGAKTLAKLALDGQDPESWVEEDLAEALYTKDLPEPDLLIRTGGEYRISNFMLWQLAYTEFWFTPTLWPDFGERELSEAMAAFCGRHRRFGGV